MKKILRKAWRIFSILLLTGLVFLLLLQPLYQGFMTRYTILKALDGAKSVRVIEHSNPWDDRTGKENYRETIYSDLTLNSGQISSLRKALPVRLDYSDSVALACLYIEHHRVEIEQADGKTFVFGICFHCGVIAFDHKVTGIMPWGWGSSLREFMISLGLKPDGPFKKEKN